MSAARARLAKFRLIAYRSCKDASFSPQETITALIGPNGSGKTNIMQGILLLQLQTSGRRYREDDDPYSSKCRVEADFIFRKKKVRYKASVKYGLDQLGQDNMGISDQKWNFKDITGKSQWIKNEELPFILQNDEISYRRNSRGRRVIYLGDGRMRYLPPTFFSLGGVSRAINATIKDKSTPPTVKNALLAYNAITKLRYGIKYYSASQFTNPALCPTSFDIDEDGDLIVEGSIARRLPHTRFIFDLYRLYRGKNISYDSFLSLVDKRGVGLLDKLRWREVKFSSPAYEVRAGGRVTTKRVTRIKIIPTLQIGNSQLSFNQLSEGTLRSLAMIFYIVTDKSELLLLEEPEVCVHHGLLRSVIAITKEYSRSKQIILSTHSESVIDNLQPEEVMLVDKMPQAGTVIRPISQTMSRVGYRALKNYLSKVGALGEFWRQSGFQQ